MNCLIQILGSDVDNTQLKQNETKEFHTLKISINIYGALS